MSTRTIKFRAWDKSLQLMLAKWPDMECFEMVGLNGDDRFAVMQYTGLKDKNGTPIFEGDIVTGQTSYESNNDEMEWTREKPRVVEWNEIEAGFRPFTYNNRWRCDVVDIEVIGNIYENPDLIK